MADNLVDLFFDPAKPDNGLETAWLVCQRCLHGCWAWHLRYSISHLNWESLGDPDKIVFARELKQRIIKYYPDSNQPPPGRAPRLPHLGPVARNEIYKQFMRLKWFLSQDVSDEDAEAWRLDHFNPPGFECLSNEF